MRIPNEWAVRHHDARAYGRLVGAHLVGDHFLRSKRFAMRAYGWWHYECVAQRALHGQLNAGNTSTQRCNLSRAGRASESGFHYDGSSLFMGLVPEQEESMKAISASAWKEAAKRLTDMASAVGFAAVLPEVILADPSCVASAEAICTRAVSCASVCCACRRAHEELPCARVLIPGGMR